MQLLIPIKKRLAENLQRTHDRIHEACHRANRDPAEITLVAVTKYAELQHINALLELGVVDIGESRVQELSRRAAAIQESAAARSSGLPLPRWHMIGHLQRNKIRPLLPWASLIHSVDSLRLAEEIDTESARLDRVQPVLLEVNASGESTKQGIAVAAATHFVEQCSTLKNLELRGLMAMAPLTDDAGVIRGAFERVRELFEEIITERCCGPQFRDLSIGMSNDFEHAIEFGATIVRIGSALFDGIELATQPTAAD